MVRARVTQIWAVAAVLSFACAASPVRAADRAAPDFVRARDEVVRFTSDLVKIDTSNPPGNETAAARYVADVLRAEGVTAQLFEAEPGRANLVARLAGNGKKKPILLMGHLDVVPVERSRWTVEPFAATVRGDMLYGRGTVDDKGPFSALLEVFLLLHRARVPLDRDVILLATAGEETGGKAGIEFMLEKHPDAIAAEFALNEGGSITIRDRLPPYLTVSTSEKVQRTIRVVARGTPGHAALWRPDNAVTHLSVAVGKIGGWLAPVRLNETTRTYFERLSRVSAPEDARLFEHPDRPDADEALRRRYPREAAALRTTVSPTVLKAGQKVNVVPGEAEALLDARGVPDEDWEELGKTLNALVADPSVSVEIQPSTRGAGLSSTRTEMFRALEAAQARVLPRGATLPSLLFGGTDSSALRARGIQAYGVGPKIDVDSGAHAHDEHVSIEGLGRFVELVFDAVQDVARAR